MSDYLPTPILQTTYLMSPLFMKVLRARQSQPKYVSLQPSPQTKKITTFVANVDDKLIFEQLLDGFVSLATLQVANTSNEFFGDVLVVAHTDLDGCQDSELLFGDEVQVLGKIGSTSGSSFIFCYVVDYYTIILNSMSYDRFEQAIFFWKQYPKYQRFLIPPPML